MKKPILFTLLTCVSFFATSQVPDIQIHPNNRVASYQLSSSRYNSWVNNDEFINDLTERRQIIKDIYEVFTDEFDFIFLVLNEDDRPASINYFGIYAPISNSISGIGGNLYDFTNSYGSDGKLKGVMQIPALDFIERGPTLHELMHNWANRAIDSERISTASDGTQSSASAGSHWGYMGGSNRGQLGGFDQSTLIENGNNSYTVNSFGWNANGGNGIPYTELELYLMGMIPVSEVSEFDVFTGLSNRTSSDGKITFSASNRITYTSDMLISELGEREPNSTNSQKDFKLLTIVLTDRPLTNQEWDLADQQIERFGRPGDDGNRRFNFWEATGGRGTLDVENIQSATLGIATNQLEEITNFRMYPIPAKDQLTVMVNNQYKIQNINLHNMLGQLVVSKASYPEQQNTIPIHSLQAGMYTLEVKVNGIHSPIIKRIVVSN